MGTEARCSSCSASPSFPLTRCPTAIAQDGSPVGGIERPPNGYGLFSDAFQIGIANFNRFQILPSKMVVPSAGKLIPQMAHNCFG